MWSDRAWTADSVSELHCSVCVATGQFSEFASGESQQNTDVNLFVRGARRGGWAIHQTDSVRSCLSQNVFRTTALCKKTMIWLMADVCLFFVT
jgi:hypothetical protein